MRTTLDIDPRVMASARARVHEGLNRSIGEAVSDMALANLITPTRPRPATNGLVLLPDVPGHVITNEMVAEALLDE
ncbi:MAG: hypothetical protein FWG47_02160 [Propionibacteriaceae bacterium]|nr:hypothetical protein [Propionibacteriaceae bacterium]